MIRRCIFHVPNNINLNTMSGSQVRPNKMIGAFKLNGYEVEVVSGYGKDRKKQIKKIKQNIQNGVKYDFIYSESSTMPTLLTEKNHMPIYPFLDFGFFKFAKKNGVKIGLFYRDAYWKFPLYKENVKEPFASIAILMYKYDLKKYKSLVDVLFLPSKRMLNYLGNISDYCSIKSLPPGADERTCVEKKGKELTLLYVGCIDRKLYDLTNILKSVEMHSDIIFNLCCRKAEWEENESYYNQFITNRVKIIHTSGDGLIPYYNKSDVCCLITNTSEYRAMAMPVKLFEYISYEKPILITDGSVGADFVKENKIGFVVEDNVGSIYEMLDFLLKNPEKIKGLEENLKRVHVQNTWKERARTVIELLK